MKESAITLYTDLSALCAGQAYGERFVGFIEICTYVVWHM
jgi:hypothetical protein